MASASMPRSRLVELTGGGREGWVIVLDTHTATTGGPFGFDNDVITGSGAEETRVSP